METLIVLGIVVCAFWYGIGKKCLFLIIPYLPIAWQKKFGRSKQISLSACGECNACAKTSACHDAAGNKTIQFLR